MDRLLSRLPWFLSAPLVLVAVGVFGYVGYYFGNDHFERTFLDEQGFVFERPVAAADDPTPQPTDPAGETATEPEPAATATAPPDSTEPEPATAEATATQAPAEPTATPEPPAATLVAVGEFRDGDPGHNGAGQAYLLISETGELVLRFENFSVTNGPDLRVVLTRETGGGGYSNGLELGPLKASDGNFNYTIPPGTDLSQYTSVIIWCHPFSVLFAYADFTFEA